MGMIVGAIRTAEPESGCAVQARCGASATLRGWRPICERHPGTSSDLQLGLSVADDLVARLFGNRIHDRAAITRLGHTHPAELDGQPLQCRRTSGGLCLSPRDLRHGPQSMHDAPGQADGSCELLVDVDGIEIARSTGVAVGEVLVGSDPYLGDLGSLCQLGHDSDSSDDVGPGSTADLFAALVYGDGLEHVVAAAIAF